MTVSSGQLPPSGPVAAAADPQPAPDLASTSRRLPSGELLDDFLPYLINIVMAQGQRHLVEKLRALNLSFQDWRVLLVLSQRGGLPISTLSRQTVVDKSTLSRVLTRMEDRGLIRRDMEERDGRVTRVCLTPAGEAAFISAYPIADAERRRMFRGFSEDDLDNLLRLFRVARRNERA